MFYPYPIIGSQCISYWWWVEKEDRNKTRLDTDASMLGSIPEKEEASDKIYNTLTAYDPSGKMIAKHRKVHLFDIDVPGKITFKVIVTNIYIDI